MPRASRRSDENVLKQFWRPLTAYTYLLICLFDFMLAPIALSWYCWFTNVAYIPWEPLTLHAGGLFHMSMGAILGVAAWTRGVEKSKWIDYDRDYDRNYSDDSSYQHTSERTTVKPVASNTKGGINNSDDTIN